MNVFWIQDGKKICIFAMFFYPLGLLSIFTTSNPPLAAAMGAMLAFFSILTFKSAEGWAVKRYWKKQEKAKKRKFGYLHN